MSIKPSTKEIIKGSIKPDSTPNIHDVSRLVIENSGKIIYASPEIIKLLQLKQSDIGKKQLREVIEFICPEDALRDRPSFGFNICDDNENNDAWTESIISGNHDIICINSKNKKSKELCLHFDRIDLPNGKSYLIASSLNDKSDNDNDNFDLSNLLDTINKPKQEQKPKAKTKRPKIQKKPQQDIWFDFLPAFTEMGNDFMFLLSPRGKIEHANCVFYNALGGDKDFYNGKSFLDLIHIDDRQYVQPIFKNLIQSETVDTISAINFECRVVDQKNQYHWLDCRIKINDKHLMVVARDLTAIKHSENELRRREQQLSEAQSIGHMGHWTWRMGEDKLEFSPEIYRIFDVDPNEFIPTIDNVNGIMHRRDRGRMSQAFQRALIERKNYVMEFRIIRPNGESRYIELQGRCERDSDGDVSALFGVMQDITERTKHETELRSAMEEAERAYAAKSQFLANMSHELRTPLNAIIGFSEMIGRQMLGPIGTEKYLDYISGIRESGEHLLDLITDILDMSKIEAGKYTLDIEEFNLFKVIRLAIHMIEGRALDAQVKVYSNINDDENLYIVADRRAVMQMILNLLSNSVKFTEPEGEVHVSCTIINDKVSILVKDTGIGIPANKLRYVTKPFEQAANQFTRSHEGTGLGLAITKELAELHGGSLNITSTVGIGTQVIITLPINQN